MKNKKKTQIGAVDNAAKTVNINLNSIKMADSEGSVSWLLNQPVKLTFGQKTVDSVTFRYAELSINDRVATIAADGAFRYEEALVWCGRYGYHEIDIQIDSQFQQDPPFGVALTPAAARLVERIADVGRNEFRIWIDENGVDAGVEVMLNKVTA